MTTMIERVARAICAADRTAPDPDAQIQIGMRAAKAWEARVPMARAAIEVMREPTPEMQAVGRDAVAPYFPRGAVGMPVATQWEPSNKAYEAMIDAALKEVEHAGLP